MSLEWMDHAKCAPLGRYWDHLDARDHAKICGQCPVARLCADYMGRATQPAQPARPGGLRVGDTCKRGHLIGSAEDLRSVTDHGHTRLDCVACRRARMDRENARRREATGARARRALTVGDTCVNGHVIASEADLRRTNKASGPAVYCRTCANETTRRYYQKKRAARLAQQEVAA